MSITRDDVLRNYGEGVDAIERYAGRFGDGDWAARALGVWNAAELMTHVAHIAAWYHERVDRAEALDLSPSYDADDFDQWTIEQVATAVPATPPERVREFTTAARSYAMRIPSLW